MRVPFRIPLIGRGIPRKSPLAHALNGTLTKRDYRRWAIETEKKTRQFTILKPQRSLGAPWIDNFVALRKIVALCEGCRRKYNNWWIKHNYVPKWKPVRSDCDGCGQVLRICTDFYPAEFGERARVESIH